MRPVPGNDLILGQLAGRNALLDLSRTERDKHLYCCGGTGTGKSKFLENLIRQDIWNWRKSRCGMLVLDPHGSLYDSLIEWLARCKLDRPIIPIDLRQDDWIVSYNLLRQREATDPAVLVDNITDAMAYASDIYEFGGIAAPNGGAVSYFPTSGHPEYGQTFPLRYNYTNNPTPPTGDQIIADENALMTLLTNSVNRNFYFNGHGNAEAIATLDSQRIAIALKKHYYRFVFLDACSTANGSLPASFGINFSSSQPLTYFQAHGTRPRTFIGYTKDVVFADVGDYVDGSGNHYVYRIPDRNLYFLSNFEFYWYFNYDLTTSIYNAQNDTPDLRYGWEDGADLNVYGYDGLYINQYNYQTDWSN